MKQELVEKVAAQLEACWATDDESGWRNMARYALALAERAARGAAMQLIADEIDGLRVAADAVERAVEGA